ncbi:hypothetical protein [Nonomuraea sp. NPDC049709]|uniref:hypothetical protein n=1 Tax=Nonomuraea sp. NPDC049709 TaxID=3154736 RepID=UPI00341D4872
MRGNRQRVGRVQGREVGPHRAGPGDRVAQAAVHPGDPGRYEAGLAVLGAGVVE